MNRMEPWTIAPRPALPSVLRLVYTAWIILGVGRLYAKGGCPAGWFGPNCSYQCHCQVYNTCAFTDGSCSVNDTCAPSYFGPGCQYYDISGLSSVYFTPQYLLDHNDTTCNLHPTQRSAYLDWQTYYVIHWLRIVVEDRSNLQDFQLLLEGQICINERRYAVSDTSVDVVCDNTATIRWLELSGPAVGSLCSIYVSIGRNIALKQQTRQSSDWPAAPDTGLSWHAVDGNTDADYYGDSCTMTAEERNASWEVIFNRLYILSHIRMHNNNDFYIGLVNFTISVYNGKYIMFMIRPNTTWNTHYYYNIDTTVPGTSVRILSLQQTALSLCEVEIFGEAVCPENTYGLNCEKHCTCGKNQSCSTATGACSARCSRGTYGFKCSQYCSESCQGDCLERLGHCSSCGIGFRGALCTDVCSAGTYGHNCLSNCSENCQDTCNHISGRCNCTPGHTGQDCTDCPAGRFGVNCQSNCSTYCLTTCDVSNGSCSCKQGRTGLHCEKCLDGQVRDNCTQTCPPNCADNMCNMTSVTCVSCTGNFTGPNCSDCLEGYSGDMCHKQCSIYCANRTCDVQTQKCFSCVYGFRGDYCEEDCRHGQYGAHCEYYCSMDCYNRDCNETTGACFRCNGQRTGTLCTVRSYICGFQDRDCPRKKYGEKCESSCSKRCLYQECDPNFGICRECIEGFTGDKCDKGADAWMIYVLGLFVVFIVVGLGIWYLLERRKKDNVESGPEDSKSSKRRRHSEGGKIVNRASLSNASTSTESAGNA